MIEASASAQVKSTYWVGIMNVAYPSGRDFEQRFGPFPTEAEARQQAIEIPIREANGIHGSFYQGKPETARVFRIDEVPL